VDKPKRVVTPVPAVADAREEAVPSGQVERVRDLIQVLVNTIQAARLFPPEHQTVVNFVSDLHARLTGYLDEHGELEIGIEEQSLTLAGKPVHEDPVPAKSLPFFFFKDGMKALVFCRGLKVDEVGELLATIRSVSSLPAEEGDIVNALWEKDFANIRYLAPDDYLETKIGQGRKLLEWPIDRPAMSTGRIDLSPEDLEDIRNRIQTMGRGRGTDDAAWKAELARELSSPVAPAREAEEKREIDSLLTANRGISADDEYLNLMIEILYLEDRSDQYPGLADSVRQYHRQLIARRDFTRAARLLQSLLELRETWGGSHPEKAAMLAAAFGDIAGQEALAELEEALRPPAADSDESILPYLRLVGPPAARLIGGLYGRARTPAAREAALEALRKIGGESLETLMSLVQESSPGLTRQVIALVSRSHDKRVVPFLAGFKIYGDPSVRIDAVRALGRVKNDAAGRILLGFLSDQAESVRICALENIGCADRETVRQLLDHMGGAPGLKKRSLAEKRAVMSALGRSRSEDACAWLRRVLEKTPFLPDPKYTELRLCAVEALSGMPDPEAREALRMGARKRSRKVRDACLKALQGPARAGEPRGPGDADR
jgi:HEAT repeat protein